MDTFKQLLEGMNSILEDELVDDFSDVDIENTDIENTDTESTEENIVGRTELSLTDELDAKAKISRALDALKVALETFKESTFVEIDLIADSEITLTIENLSKEVDNITNLLRGKGIDKEFPENQLSLDTPSEKEEEETEELEEEPEETEESSDKEPDETEENEEEEVTEPNFDDEAELDLFGED